MTPTIKYRDNMTDEELAEFARQLREQEEIFSSVDWGNPAVEDEMEILRRAALDSRGRP